MCSKKNNSRNRPGWSDYVAELYDYSRELRKLWLDNGKPRQGFISHEFHRSKAKFKYALRYIKRNENTLRKEALAKKLSDLNVNDFWKEIRKINNSKTTLPSSINNANSPEEINKLWEDHFDKLFNCLDKVPYKGGLSLNESYNSIKVNNFEISDAIDSLDLNKT